jgi:plastocyanin
MPAVASVVELRASEAPGSWPYYCNILDHINAGMRGRIVVA